MVVSHHCHQLCSCLDPHHSLLLILVGSLNCTNYTIVGNGCIPPLLPIVKLLIVFGSHHCHQLCIIEIGWIPPLLSTVVTDCVVVYWLDHTTAINYVVVGIGWIPPQLTTATSLLHKALWIMLAPSCALVQLLASRYQPPGSYIGAISWTRGRQHNSQSLMK